MEEQMVWQDSYNIGVEIIDREHQRLFRIINRLFAFREEGKDSQWTCQEGIKYFKAHAVKHFADEEAYMESIGYEGLETHRYIHKDFRDNILPALERELERAGYTYSAVDHFLGVCTGWLIGHTMIEDQAIVGRHDQRWASRFTDQEQTDIKKVIIQMLFEMFKLEAHLVSDTYSGEKFGKGVYCRLIWGSPKEDKKLEIFLAMEEQFLINTVGKVLGLSTGNLDSMLLHAARYTGRQFVTEAMKCFPELSDYSVEGESFLSYEQFRKLMEKGEHQIGFLLDTGAGYFGYCVVAPRLLETGVGICITGDTATADVAKYLEQREKRLAVEEARNLPKILVVDDSSTLREAMHKLLEKDYEVMLADSGMAAIRNICLNRPDMVLLDYEMPVCDGRQTLEMLRSERTFDNIPVIFLTGRDDPEVVRALLALKPAGYLLKYLKPADIKQKIDELFNKLCR